MSFVVILLCWDVSGSWIFDKLVIVVDLGIGHIIETHYDVYLSTNFDFVISSIEIIL